MERPSCRRLHWTYRRRQSKCLLFQRNDTKQEEFIFGICGKNIVEAETDAQCGNLRDSNIRENLFERQQGFAPLHDKWVCPNRIVANFPRQPQSLRQHKFTS